MPVNESNTIQYTVVTSRVADGTTLYWRTTGNTTNSDIVGGNTGSITVNNNRAVFNVALVADVDTDGTKTLGISILTGSVNGTPVVNTATPIVVNDTSITPQEFSIDYLVVAGGAGGAGSAGPGAGGGGGGAGGFLSNSLLIIPGVTYTITVGSGGAASFYNDQPGSAANGTNSVISGTPITTVTSFGGGAGGRQSARSAPSGAGYSGGSGGGGGSSPGDGNAPWAGGTGGLAIGSPGSGVIGTQGYPGGTLTGPTDQTGGGGGGGGAGGAGAGGFASSDQYGNATPSSYGGAGGAGRSNSITGSPVFYAGGGGGARYYSGGTSGAGGIGGGGAGGVPAGSGQMNTGGGGGGGTFQSPGGGGGSGIVILSIPTPRYPGSAPGATVTTPPAAPGKTILTYTSSGTYTA